MEISNFLLRYLSISQLQKQLCLTFLVLQEYNVNLWLHVGEPYL